MMNLGAAGPAAATGGLAVATKRCRDNQDSSCGGSLQGKRQRLATAVPPPPPAKSSSAGIGPSVATGADRSLAVNDGNWPCHVFIRIGRHPSCSFSTSSPASISFVKPFEDTNFASSSDDDSGDEGPDALKELVRTAEPALVAQVKLQQGGTRNNVVQLHSTGHPLHISLSHGFTLRHHERALFLSRLRRELQRHQPFEVIVTDEVVSYINRSCTRCFFALTVAGGNETVVNLIQSVDKVMALFNLEKYHSDPKIHVSVAWVAHNSDVKGQCTAGVSTASGRAANDGINTGSVARTAPSLGVECAFKVSSIRCRVGDDVHIIRLAEEQ